MYYPLDSPVGDPATACQVENAEVFIYSFRSEVDESGVGKELASSETKFAKGLAVFDHGGYWCVSNKFAILEVELKDVRAVHGKSHDRLVSDLTAVVELELCIELAQVVLVV